MYSENYKILLQETEDDLNQGLTNYGLQLLASFVFLEYSHAHLFIWVWLLLQLRNCNRDHIIQESLQYLLHCHLQKMFLNTSFECLERYYIYELEDSTLRCLPSTSISIYSIQLQQAFQQVQLDELLLNLICKYRGPKRGETFEIEQYWRIYTYYQESRLNMKL